MYSLIRLTAADITKWIAWGPVRLHYLTGYSNQSSDRFIQIFEKPAAAIAASDVPALPGFFAPSLAPFDWPFPSTYEINLSEISIGISSTQVNYTAAGANTGLDLVALVESEFLVTSKTTIAGDLTSNVNSLQVWSEANGVASPNRLLRLDITNGFGNDVGPIISALDTPSTTLPPFQVLKKIADSLTTKYFFGVGGTSPFTKTDINTTKRGCTIKLVDGTTSLGLPYTFISSGTSKIRAIYENE